MSISPMTMIKESWGMTPLGEPANQFMMRNAQGMQVRITNYGGIVVGLRVPDRKGQMDDVVLGFDSLDEYTTDTYLAESPYFGALIGRYANHIGHARFQLNGKPHRLAANSGPHHLHGGTKGFDRAVWEATEGTGPEPSLTLKYTSKDGEEGYPGNLDVTVVYTLKDQNELRIDYTATTDEDTVVNLTHHSYFNLKGHGEGDILGHELQVFAEEFTLVDADLIPTGEIRSVSGTSFDFTKPIAIGAGIESQDPQIAFGKGYDHNFLLTPGGQIRGGRTLVRAARVSEPTTGRVMEVWTTEPGVQLYTANGLKGNLTGKNGKVYGYRGAFCLEPQHFPDSPNNPQFPSTVVRPGTPYRSTTVFRFSADGAVNREG
jgi:aldose 1-epimerase